MSMANLTVSMTINGKKTDPVEVPETLMMIDFLHEFAHLTGTRLGCGQGVCRACVVIVDDDNGHSREMRTCITGVGYFNGRKLRTIEGLAQRDETGAIRALTPVQQAFLDHYSFQCGYCTPGFVNAATVLVERLQRQPVHVDQLEQTIEDGLNDHICRCTGYVRYYQAVKTVILETPGLVVSDGQAGKESAK